MLFGLKPSGTSFDLQWLHFFIKLLWQVLLTLRKFKISQTFFDMFLSYRNLHKHTHSGINFVKFALFLTSTSLCMLKVFLQALKIKFPPPFQIYISDLKTLDPIQKTLCCRRVCYICHLL